MQPVALVGSLSLDRVAGAPPRIGGGAFYGARAFRAVGRRGRILTSCAAPDRSRLLPRLAATGVPVSWRDSAQTPSFSFSYDGDRRTMSIDVLGDPWLPEHVRLPQLGRVEWVHVAPLVRSEFPLETLSELARGRRVSFDGQGLVRPARIGPLELDAEFDVDVLRRVSILKLAEEEAHVVLGGEVTRRGLRDLGVLEVVVTLGERGSLVYAEGRLESVRARPIAAPDPTGAGDAFAVAYLAGRSEGAAPVGAARRATAVVAALLSGRAA